MCDHQIFPKIHGGKKPKQNNNGKYFKGFQCVLELDLYYQSSTNS